eukprot:PhF_6_TR44282/c0_g1_i2/m.68242/K12818/DHX8, PRP22; ATP-dependent RNA helicase DHX8/PRP22
MSLRDLFSLYCTSTLCHKLQPTFESDSKDVANFLLEQYNTTKPTTAAQFTKEIHELDGGETPQAVLDVVFGVIDPVLRTQAPEIEALAKKTHQDYFRKKALVLDLTPNLRKRELEEVTDGRVSLTDDGLYIAYQLARSGVATESSMVQNGMAGDDIDADLNTRDIKVRDELPHFLRNEKVRMTAASVRKVHVANVIKDPAGTLMKGIQTQQQNMRESKEARRELRRKEVGLDGDRTEVHELDHIKVNSTNGALMASRSIQEQRKSLRIYEKKKEFLDAVARNDVLVIIGETGSGKTTQMTQYLAEAGYYGKGKIIGCTQPRKLPARSVSERVAQEFGCTLGDEVGFTVRFEDKTSSRTIIKYMTDGILLREALNDPMFSRYSVLIIDEAHERNINTDVLLGLLKRATQKGRLKLLVTSATLNVDKFSRFFNNAEIFKIEGRAYPVDIRYEPSPVSDYIEACAKCISNIHFKEPPGDVLVFLPGKEEIETCADQVMTMAKKIPPDMPKVIVHTIYASMPTDVQEKGVFTPTPQYPQNHHRNQHCGNVRHHRR